MNKSNFILAMILIIIAPAITHSQLNRSSDPTVAVSTVISAPGTVSVPVEMINFTDNINSFTFRIATDSDLIPFVELGNLGPGLQSGSLQSFQNDTLLTIT